MTYTKQSDFIHHILYNEEYINNISHILYDESTLNEYLSKKVHPNYRSFTLSNIISKEASIELLKTIVVNNKSSISLKKLLTFYNASISVISYIYKESKFDKAISISQKTIINTFGSNFKDILILLKIANITTCYEFYCYRSTKEKNCCKQYKLNYKHINLEELINITIENQLKSTNNVTNAEVSDMKVFSDIKSYTKEQNLKNDENDLLNIKNINRIKAIECSKVSYNETDDILTRSKAINKSYHNICLIEKLLSHETWDNHSSTSDCNRLYNSLTNLPKIFRGCFFERTAEIDLSAAHLTELLLLNKNSKAIELVKNNKVYEFFAEKCDCSRKEIKTLIMYILYGSRSFDYNLSNNEYTLLNTLKKVFIEEFPEEYLLLHDTIKSKSKNKSAIYFQNKEFAFMSKVKTQLLDENIRHILIHDAFIISEDNAIRVKEIMESEFELKYGFKISMDIKLIN